MSHMKFKFTFGCLLVLSAMVTGAEAQRVESLSVMTLNVWSAENSQGGRDKLVEIIQAADPDIVGLQEMGNSAGQEIANALGYNYQQQSGGDIQVLSRYPIIGQSPANRGAQIELSPDQNIWIFNAHFAPYPYQPYDLRDGTLASDEAAVIAAANASRGWQVTSYLDEMADALASGDPVFFTGDFNEPSHLDWTQAAADATARPFDLKVEYPASKRITDAGMTDSFRAVRPDEVNDTGYTWTPGAPPPNVSANEVLDRIDIIYHSGFVVPTNAFTVGLNESNPNTDLGIAGYNADHRAVVAEFDLSPFDFLPGDVNLDGVLSGDGTGPAESDDVRAFIDGWMTVLPTDDIITRWTKGDLNVNGRSELGDLVLFQEALISAGLTFPGFDGNLPEPTSMAMGWFALSAFVLVSKRRAAKRV